jgi:hypothetical protein
VVLAADKLGVLVLVEAPTTTADVAAASAVNQTEVVAVAVVASAITDLETTQRQQEVVGRAL